MKRQLQRDIFYAASILAVWAILNFWLIWWREAHGIAAGAVLTIVLLSTLLCIHALSKGYRTVKNYLNWHDDILNCLEIPVIVMDLDFHVILINKAAREIIPVSAWNSILSVQFVEGKPEESHALVECGNDRYNMRTSRLLAVDKEHIGYVKMLEPCGRLLGHDIKELLALHSKLLEESIISADNV